MPPKKKLPMLSIPKSGKYSTKKKIKEFVEKPVKEEPIEYEAEEQTFDEELLNTTKTIIKQMLEEENSKHKQSKEEKAKQKEELAKQKAKEKEERKKLKLQEQEKRKQEELKYIEELVELKLQEKTKSQLQQQISHLKQTRASLHGPMPQLKKHGINLMI